MAKRATSRANTQIDYTRLVWDRLENIAYPGEHTNLFGHDGSLDQLTRAFHSAHMHHAWLVTGPRGIGKASLALAFAGHVFGNPHPGSAPQTFSPPAPHDPVISQIAKGGHPNILHLSRPYDPKTKRFKSTITIDEIRRTQSFFGTTAGEDSWRICIVDTADDMNANAANALLKILEEPPVRTLFFVLSNAPGKLLPTIRSRCRHLPLRPLSATNLIKAMEALECPIDQLDQQQQHSLLRLSDGSVRRAIVLLQQEGMALVQRFNDILGQGADNQRQSNAPNWPAAHKLADELARKANEEQYALLFDVARDYVSTTIHAASTSNEDQNPQSAKNNSETLSNLARLCEVWEKIEKSASVVDAYNLDKKQVVLNLFSDLAQARI